MTRGVAWVAPRSWTIPCPVAYPGGRLRGNAHPGAARVARPGALSPRATRAPTRRVRLEDRLKPGGQQGCRRPDDDAQQRRRGSRWAGDEHEREYEAGGETRAVHQLGERRAEHR